MTSFTEALAVSVAATGNTILKEFPVAGYSRIFVEFTVATNALDAFIISARSHIDAAFTTLYSASADYTTPTGLLVGTSSDLTSVSAGSSGWFIMDVASLDTVRIQASASGGTAIVSIYVGGQ